MLFDFLGLYPCYGHKILTCPRLVMSKRSVLASEAEAFTERDDVKLESSGLDASGHSPFLHGKVPQKAIGVPITPS